MRRRDFLAAAAAGPMLRARSSHLDMSRIAVLTDECATSPAEAIAFTKTYGLRWVELRSVPGLKGHHYGSISSEEAKQAAKEFRDAGVRVSFLNTGFLKIALPDTEPLAKAKEGPEAWGKRVTRYQAEFERRLTDLDDAIRNAHIYGVDKLRVFTFLRVQEPASVYPRVADIIGEMAHHASKEGVKVLVENEGACNVVTSDELARFTRLLPDKNVGINWDPHNGLSQHEVPFPDGYKLLPKKRILNVQFKGKSLLEPKETLPWRDIFTALDKDGYNGVAGLETHYFDGTLIEKANLSMVEIRRILNKS